MPQEKDDVAPVESLSQRAHVPQMDVSQNRANFGTSAEQTELKRIAHLILDGNSGKIKAAEDAMAAFKAAIQILKTDSESGLIYSKKNKDQKSVILHKATAKAATELLTTTKAHLLTAEHKIMDEQGLTLPEKKGPEHAHVAHEREIIRIAIDGVIDDTVGIKHFPTLLSPKGRGK